MIKFTTPRGCKVGIEDAIAQWIQWKKGRYHEMLITDCLDYGCAIVGYRIMLAYFHGHKYPILEVVPKI